MRSIRSNSSIMSLNRGSRRRFFLCRHQRSLKALGPSLDYFSNGLAFKGEYKLYHHTQLYAHNIKANMYAWNLSGEMRTQKVVSFPFIKTNSLSNTEDEIDIFRFSFQIIFLLEEESQEKTRILNFFSSMWTRSG